MPGSRARNRSHDHHPRATSAAWSAPVRGVLSVALTIGLASATVACGPGGGSSTDPDPTFHRVENRSLRFTKPLSTVTDLLPPAGDGEPWRVVGSILDPGTGRSTAAVWTSDDGRGWERDDVDPAEREVSESLAAAARFGDGQLAVGQLGDEGALDAAIWRADGDDWSVTAPPEMGGKHDQWAFDVAVGESGVLVAGGESAWGEIRPRLWFSADGESWRSVDGGPGGPLDQTGEESIQAISAFGQGFVAVGWRDLDGDQDGIAWYSADGVSWEQLTAPSLGGPGRQNVQSVTAVGNTLVAGGFGVDATGQGRPVVWRSNDGRTWGERSGVLPVAVGNRTAATDMTIRSFSVNADGSEILAAGGDDWRPQIWHSVDAGASWQLVGSGPLVHGGLFEDGVALVDVARFGDQVVALGGEPTVLQLQNRRWLDATDHGSFPTGGRKPAATSVLADRGKLLTAGYHLVSRTDDARERFTGSVWLGDGDGDDLDEVEPKGQAEHLLAGMINDLSRFKGGYVAVGFEDFSLADKRNAADGKPNGLIWTSPDGKRWTRRATHLPKPDPGLLSILDEDPNVLAETAYQVIATQPMLTDDPAGGSGTRSLEAVAPLGSGFIAVGSAYRDVDGNPQTKSDYDTDPVVVISADGNAIQGQDTGLNGPGSQRFRDVCVRDGQALAVGVSSYDNSFDVAVRLRGRDGRWRPGEATDNSFVGNGGGSQEAFGCAASAEGFIVVGADSSRGNSDARVWTSADGISWKQVTSGALGGAGEQAARAVAAVPDGGWLIGGTDTIGGDSDAALWRLDSSGQITRRDRDEPSLGGPGTQAVAAISVTDDHTVLVGEDQAGIGMWETGDLDR